jgi:hypothetical protein
MTHFLKLKHLIINITKIIKIDILPTKYTMFMSSQIPSSGFIDSYNIKIEICKDKHPIDYQIIKEWIDHI